MVERTTIVTSNSGEGTTEDGDLQEDQIGRARWSARSTVPVVKKDSPAIGEIGYEKKEEARRRRRRRRVELWWTADDHDSFGVRNRQKEAVQMAVVVSEKNQ
ncbi:hypothetical protein ACOSQ3_004369 [Xanthoceras sorbifolium]